ncbi:hypothetical protein [Mycolicibacterium mucogenicum]|uniref:Uncharacterized protein n=1 Tax=Mycolicibacterium mucogenicum DSM 44124 TaxID=1226753 RepID=A0A8H2J8X5_MYCMU|nr:hypothetical protein [Mycolicibacterium mucogenicum]KAB7761767.1 hypothetical protein MMUC44124_00950 [Mycolicibacterium mucogenicum DSM 44124]QPG69999.1 hypothetical protein C1S78_002935 [Mycolicibacterium mucogenicum DSM 44124]
MDLNVNLPHDSRAPKVKALVAEAKRMGSDPQMRYGASHVLDHLLGGLLTIVADLEHEINVMKADKAEADRKATLAEHQMRQYGG